MSATRALTATLLAATTLTMSGLAAGPAHAGGAPDLGDVSVDREARLAGGEVTVSGTYVCTVPDAPTVSGPGTIGVELVSRSGAPAHADVAVTCDGTERAWSVTAPAGELHRGRGWAHGHLEVRDASGNTPWELFDGTVTVVGGR